jgi:anti-sigma regulatory factor (Ser/Thr protein kinase)
MPSALGPARAITRADLASRGIALMMRGESAAASLDRMNSPDTVKKAQIVIANSIAEMARVADLVDRFGAEHAIPQRAIDNMNVCLDELLNNTISYGYSDDKAHEIAVELSLVDRALLIAEVRDDGMAFDPRQAAAPAFDGSVGGLGIHFVRKLMDAIDYLRVGKYNVVRITKKLQPEA